MSATEVVEKSTKYVTIFCKSAELVCIMVDFLCVKVKHKNMFVTIFFDRFCKKIVWIHCPTLYNPHGILVEREHTFHNITITVFGFLFVKFATFVTNITCIKVSYITKNLFLTFIKELRIFHIISTVRTNNKRLFNAFPFALFNGWNISVFSLYITRNHSCICL